VAAAWRNERKDKDLSTHDIKDIIDNVPPKTVIGFTGGEFSIREDFLELCEYTVKTDHLLGMQTNGTGLTYENVKEMSSYKEKIGIISIAIHSHKEQEHNFIVRDSTDSMYKKTIKGLDNCLTFGIPTLTQTVLSRYNLNSAFETYLFLQSKEPGIHMNLTYPHGMGNAYSKEVLFRYSEFQQLDLILSCWAPYINVEAIPLCYLHKYKNSIASIPDIESRDIKGYHNEYIKSYNTLTKKSKKKGRRCSECIYDNICIGVWEEYIEFYGDEDLIPVKST
jgi:MoaA/NifB/PqqE/SkfB family radical SAM enzyme